jgi:periplasmic divalent cation tolerance protein
MTDIAPGIVFCTCPDEACAERLARSLVENSLAACVNVIPGIRSFYRWKGEIQADGEILLVIKTDAEQWTELESFLKREHPYDVPEIVFLPITKGFQPYLDWIAESLK